jgi:NhaA family Na+:H+ antiporter
LGLFIGKQAGVFLTTRAAVAIGLAKLPEGVRWTQIYGLSLLAGIGFTMSLFIGGLSFSGADEMNAVRMGVLLGSAISAVAGFVVLRMARKG